MIFLRVILFVIICSPGVYPLYSGAIKPYYQYYVSSKSWIADTAYLDHFDGNNLEITYYFIHRNDTIYDNNIFFCPSSTSDSIYKEKFFLNFQNTQKMIVYKNQENPHENVLIREIQGPQTGIVLLIFSITWTIGCYLFSFGGFSLKAKSNQEIIDSITVLKKQG